MKQINLHILFPFVLIGMLTSCVTQKNFTPPNLESDYTLNQKADTTSFANTQWWHFFNDPTLTDLITEALQNNLSLQNTVITLKQSQLQLDIARAALYPAINYGVSASATKNTLTSDISNSATVAGNVSYTLDLWGKIKNQNEAALQAYLATEMAYYQVKAALISQISNLYFTLRDVDNKILVAEKMDASMQEFKSIIDARYDGGFISKVDVNQMDIQIKDVEITLQTLLRTRKQLENAISIAVGSTPKQIPRGKLLQEQVFPNELPTGVSLQLLQRLPSIIIAERKLKAQLATVGATEALKYPDLTLSLNLGSQLTKPSMLFAQLAGDLVGPIFNKGKINNAIEIEKEAYLKLENEYKLAYLVALQEIEDATIAISTYKKEVAIRQEQLNLSEEALDLSWVRYNEGVSSFIEFLNIQNDLFAAQLQASESYKLQLQSVAQLYFALGGGWQYNTN
ncbi:MAG: efflux transporter outer membrane subunit [Flavobacteriaceae bacterium]